MYWTKSGWVVGSCVAVMGALAAQAAETANGREGRTVFRRGALSRTAVNAASTKATARPEAVPANVVDRQQRVINGQSWKYVSNLQRLRSMGNKGLPSAPRVAPGRAVVQDRPGNQPEQLDDPAIISFEIVGPVVGAEDTIQVDVYINNVRDFRAYQLSVDVTDVGGLPVEIDDLWVDVDRIDHVFRGFNIVAAVDPFNGRSAGVLFQGGVDVTAPAYLGSFSIVGELDDNGDMPVDIKPLGDFVLRSSDRRPIAFRSELLVVGREPLLPEKSNKKE